MSERSTSHRARLPLISADAFVSETDRAALQNLQRIPLLPTITRKFNELALDHFFYATNSAEAVRCGPSQFRTVYNLMREACDILHVAEPELYVKYDQRYNAYTAGVSRTFIVLHSSLMHDLTDEELLFVIGHEVGHIKCGHVLYQTIGRVLLPLLEALGQATLGLGKVASIGLLSAFYEWLRQAEVSCDRAGLLVCQDPRVALSATMKMGAGGTRFNDEMNLDAFLDQARNHSEAGGAEGAAKVLLFLLYTWQLTHPQVVFRAKFLDEWIRSGAYERILAGDYPRDTTGAHQMGPQVRCPNCKTTASARIQYCPRCGENLRRGAAPDTTPCAGCGTALPAGTRFCPSCGLAAGAAPSPADDEEAI